MNYKWNKFLSIVLIFTILFTTLGVGSWGRIVVNAEESETVTDVVYNKEESKDEKVQETKEKINEEKLEKNMEVEKIDLKNAVESEAFEEASKDYTSIIDSSLDKLRNYYLNQSELDYLPAMAYYHSSDDVENDLKFISEKAKKYRANNIYNGYKGIMSTIASRKNPRSFENGGEKLNYVDVFINKQNKETGAFARRIDDHVYCMMALDMANADYDKEKAVDFLKSKFKDQPYIPKYNGMVDLEKTIIAIIALSNHKDIEEIADLIDQWVDYIKSQQNDEGGLKNVKETKVLSFVIQALIAVGEDPLSGDFVKNEKTLLDELMKCQIKNGSKVGAFNDTIAWGYYKKDATDAAFAALADLKQGKSMYHALGEASGGDKEPIGTPSDIILTTSQNEILEGKTVNIDYKVIDDSSKEIKGQKIIWTSSDENVATVKDGVVTAKTQGDAIITAKLENSSINKRINIKVIKRQPSKLKIYLDQDEAKEELNVKGTEKSIIFTAKILDKDDSIISSQEAVWSSDNENIATIDNNGKVTIKSTGTVKIIGKVKDMESITETITLKISPIIPTRLEAIIDKKSIVIGNKVKINVSVYDQENELMKNQNIKWGINPEGSVGIDKNNIVTALKEGDMTITASLEKSNGSKLEKNIALTIVREKSQEEKLLEAINDVKEYLKTFDGRFSNTYDAPMSVGLRAAGLDGSDIESKMNIYGMDDLHNNARNIMMIIASGNDPYNYKNKNYVERILKANLDNEDAEKISKAIVALDMAQATYDKEKFVKALIKKGNDEGEGKISFGTESNDWDDWDKEWVYNYYPNVETTSYTLMALSKYKGMDGVAETIDGIKKYLKSKQEKDASIESCSDTSFVVQGLMAIGENPLSDEWVKKDENENKITMLDVILSCRQKGEFKSKPDATGTADIQTKAAFNALLSLYKNKCVYHKIKYVKTGGLDHVRIVGDRKIQVVEGDKITVIARGYDDKDNEIKNINIILESLDKSKVIIENGVAIALEEGEVTIKASVADKPELTDEITISIKAGTSSEVLKQRLKEEIEFLKVHYEAYDQYEFVAAPAAIISGIDEIKVQEKLQTYRKYTSTYQYSKLIISALGANLDPRNIKIEGSMKNGVDILRAHQIKDGKNKGQFIINNYSDTDAIETLGYSIIALDMADADYDKESAIKALIKLLEDPNIKMKLGQDEVKIKAIALTAFANYKEIEGVSEQIESIINLFKEKQSDDGGFGSKLGEVVATARVTQALIANDINPLYDKRWIKNKKTVMDNMLENKYEHPTDISKSGFSKFGGGARNYKSTYYAFASFTDMYSNESMFKKFAIKYDKEIEVSAVAKVDILKPDNDKIMMGETLKLQTIVFDNQDNWIEKPSIVWTSSDEEKAIVKDGIIEAKKTGKVTITASIKDTDIKNSIEISIEDSGIKNIEIQCNKDKIRVEDVLELKAQGFNKVDNPIEGLAFTWVVDNKNVGKIYEKEGKTYLEALSKGKIVLKATLKDQPDIKHEINIDVIDKKSAKVKVRVEGSKNSIIPEIEIEVDNFDMGIYGDGRCLVKENPTAMNALIAALQKNNIDCTDKEKFDAGSELSKLSNINGLKEFGAGENSGWMYYVNDKYVNDYFINTSINDGDYICVYYVEDYNNLTYSYFDKNEIIVKPNESFIVQLKGRSSAGVDTNIAKASIEYKETNEKVFKKDLNVITNAQGKATLKFEKEGEYIISASRMSKGNVNISRPYCKVKVTNDDISNLFEINVLNEDEISKGKEARVKIKVKNKVDEISNMVCKIQLCDENNKVLKSSSSQKVLDAHEETILSPGFAVPEDGVYTIKVFLSNKEEIDVFKPVKIITMD